MRIGKRDFNGLNVFSSEFQSLSELLFHVTKAPINEGAFGIDLGSENADFHFTQTRSFDEAVEMCRYGYDASFSDFLNMKKTLASEMPTVAYQRGLVTDVVGFMPNVGAYLHGNPKSMYRITPQQEMKFIRLHYNCAYVAMTDYQQIMHRGIILMELIELLESIGYRVDLSFFALICNKRGSQVAYMDVSLKESGEKLDVKNCYFPLCHPSFLRRILFRLLEVTPGLDDSWKGNYGRVMDSEETTRILQLDQQKEILITSPQELGVWGRNLLEDAERFLDSLNIQDYVEVGERYSVFHSGQPKLNIFGEKDTLA